MVANGLLLNDKGLIMGEKTTGYEIIRLDDIFG
jgi:translation initiation factor 6 (eIF-6)